MLHIKAKKLIKYTQDIRLYNIYYWILYAKIIVHYLLFFEVLLNI